MRYAIDFTVLVVIVAVLFVRGHKGGGGYDPLLVLFVMAVSLLEVVIVWGAFYFTGGICQ